MLALRLAIGSAALLYAIIGRAEPVYPTFVFRIVDLMAVAGGALLLIGFLTKVAAAIVGLSNLVVALFRFSPAPVNSFDPALSSALVIIVAAALILLGPGAYSLDARLFGRRKIIIPGSSQSPKY